MFNLPNLKNRIHLLGSPEEFARIEQETFSRGQDLWFGPQFPKRSGLQAMREFAERVRKDRFEMVKAPGFAYRAFMVHLIRKKGPP